MVCLKERIARLRTDLNSEQVRRYFDYDSAVFAESRWLGSDIAREDYMITSEFLLSFLDIQHTDSLLEVGCGPGVWTALLSGRCDRITAVDISEKMIEKAKSRLKNDNVTFSRANFLDYEDDNRYDGIFSVRVIEYFPDLKRVIKKMHMLNKEGGRIVIVTKTPGTVITMRARFWRYLKALWMRKWDHFRQPGPPMKMVRPFRLRRILLECGYKKVGVYPLVIRSPLFIHGKYRLPWIGKEFNEKYERLMLKFFNWLSGKSRSMPKIIRYFLLFISETYLICGEK